MEEFLNSGGVDKCKLHKYLADQIIQEWKKFTTADLDEVKRRYIKRACPGNFQSKDVKNKKILIKDLTLFHITIIDFLR